MFNNQSPEIQKLLAGRSDFSVGTILKQAWALTQKSKLPVFGGFLFIIALGSGIEYLLAPMLGGESDTPNSATGIASLISLLVAAPFWGGLEMMALRHSRGGTIKMPDVFNYLKYFGPLALVQVLVAIMIQFGLLLLVIPAVYLAVGTSFCLMLLLDKGLTPLQAITLSIKATHKVWFKVFLVFLAITPAMALGAMPYAMYITGQGMEQVNNTLFFSVLLFWAVPMLYYAKALIFDVMFTQVKDEIPAQPEHSDDIDGNFSA